MDISVLEKAGVSRNEAVLYVALAKESPLTAGELLKRTKMVSSRVYASLRSLIQKGLISSYQKNQKQFYVAENPTIFLQRWHETKLQMTKLVGELNAWKKPTREKFESRLYEGYKGFRTAFQLILEQSTKRDEILTIGFSRPQALHALRVFLKNIDRKRMEKKIPMRVLFDQEMRNTIGKDREKELFVQVRYMPRGYCSPAAMNIVREYVLIELWQEQPVVFLIKNKAIASSFRSYFEVLLIMGME